MPTTDGLMFHSGWARLATGRDGRAAASAAGMDFHASVIGPSRVGFPGETILEHKAGDAAFAEPLRDSVAFVVDCMILVAASRTNDDRCAGWPFLSAADRR